MSRTYWRSSRQIEGDPEFLALEQREFPEGASEPPEGVTRREMMTLIGASLSLAGLAACRRPEQAIVPYVDPPENVIPGVPRHYATTMPFGRQAWGLLSLELWQQAFLDRAADFKQALRQVEPPTIVAATSRRAA